MFSFDESFFTLIILHYVFTKNCLWIFEVMTEDELQLMICSMSQGPEQLFLPVLWQTK